jgi:hypothetical protein
VQPAPNSRTVPQQPAAIKNPRRVQGFSSKLPPALSLPTDFANPALAGSFKRGL